MVYGRSCRSDPAFCGITGCASKSGSRHFRRVATPRPSSAAEPPASTKSLVQAALTAGTTAISWVSCMVATSLRPLIPPAALHQEVNTFAALASCGSLVKPWSVSTPIWMSADVTPWPVAPEALPAWQTLFRLPKSPAVDAAGDEEPDDDAGAG